jgi:hypothetical protein
MKAQAWIGIGRGRNHMLKYLQQITHLPLIQKSIFFNGRCSSRLPILTMILKYFWWSQKYASFLLKGIFPSTLIYWVVCYNTVKNIKSTIGKSPVQWMLCAAPTTHPSSPQGPELQAKRNMSTLHMHFRALFYVKCLLSIICLERPAGSSSGRDRSLRDVHIPFNL